VCGCSATNPAPLFDAPDGSLPFPEPLARAGAQVKVRLREETVLVWNGPDGLGAASIACTHLGSQVSYNPGENTLDCPSHGSRFYASGLVLRGPAARPLRLYRAVRDGPLLRLEPV
jgi:Rieske Fe-S protein